MFHKLARLEQDSKTVHVYYQKLKSYMYRCDIKESEENIRNMFFNVLNPDIQAKFKYIPLSIIGIYARACTFEKHIQEETLDHYEPFSLCSPQSVGTSNVERQTVVVWVAHPQTCTTSPPMVPTSSESDSQENNKGIDFVPPHDVDKCHVDLNISCVEIENNLLTPLVLDDQATDWHVRSVQLTEKTSVFSAPTSELASSVELSAPSKLIADVKALCDLTIESDLDHIKMVKTNEVLATILHARSLFSVMMDPPMSLSHADGPFKVTEKINDNTYKFELSVDFGMISPTFNIANLKPCFGEEDEVASRTTSI
jgi:hypothetical protein